MWTEYAISYWNCEPIDNINLRRENGTSKKEEAVQIVNNVRLLTRKELEKLFPDAEIKREKFLFFTKSFYLYH